VDDGGWIDPFIRHLETERGLCAHLDFQHLAQIYDQTHPRARKKSD